MKIRDLFKQQSALPQTTHGSTFAVKTNTVAVEQEDEVSSGKPGEDTVTISSRARHLAQIAQILGDEDHERGQKVADIKKQVADGTYSISSPDVVKSLLHYTRERSA